MKFLLDTDHLSILQRGSGAECERLTNRVAQCEQEDFCASLVSFHERTLGANSYLGRAKAPSDFIRGYAILNDILTQFATAQIVPFDDTIADELFSLKRRRIRLKPMDLRLAATALAKGLTLLTRNTVDFERVPGLRIEDWTK
jgi:tRNA(fMet)-specific endonuclease VapC